MMCRVLGVSRSGYYAWAAREPSARSKDEAQLRLKIRAIYKKHRGRYGAPRIHRELRSQETLTSKKRVARIMAEDGLRARPKRARKKRPASCPANPPAPNLLERNFTVAARDTAWVMDIKYIWTSTGWVHLAAILDLYSRKVVGWALDERIDAELCCRALRVAVQSRRPPSGLIVHTDRGSQFTSEGFAELARHHRITQSMSRKGDCWDNAVIESFFDTLSAELLEETAFTSLAHVLEELFKYIDYYNAERMHSTLGYISPSAFELLAVSQAEVV